VRLVTSQSSHVRQTLDQRRASHAWNVVQRVKNKQGGYQNQDPKKFGGQAKKLPTRIMAAGLGQALAFLRAKENYNEKDKEKDKKKDKTCAAGLLVELSDWINLCMPPAESEPKDLLERIVQGRSDFLRRATDEVLAYLVWLNRFAEAEGLTEEDR